jgi:multidrug efflux pump subunit AcrB
MSETVSYVNRARAFMPPGTVPPFVMRFDAGSVPVGYLAFSSDAKSVGQIQDLALNTIRPLFATLPGVSAPPPFGGSPRTIVIDVDPERMRAYNLSPQDVVAAVANAETISPSGNINLEGKYPIVPVNSIVRDVRDLESVPIRTGTFPAVFIRDVARISDSSDIATSIALVDGRRTVYIPVTKRAEASTLSVVNLVKANLSRFQAALPEDVSVSYVFDQSPFVTRAIAGLTTEGVLGAILTGVMVLLFLRDWRSAAIVVINIPIALLASVLALWLTGQTINLMTLGGLVLAVGILVDMSTVAIENVHTHLAKGKSIERAVADSGREVALPLLLAMLCVVVVFLPAFAMQGAARALFVPLSLAVGFSMAASYILASTLVPILAVWMHRLWPHVGATASSHSLLSRFQSLYGRTLNGSLRVRWIVVPAYLVVAALVMLAILPRLGTDIFPKVETGELQLRLRAPTGTQLEVTEAYAQRVLDLIKEEIGEANVSLSLGLIGLHSSSYPVNFIYQWNSGPQEGVLQVQLSENALNLDMDRLRERLRRRIASDIPELLISFEPADIVSRVMSFGAPTPIEVAVSGPNIDDDRAFAQKVQQKLSALPGLRDVQFGQPLDYPAVNVGVDRERAGVLGITTGDLTRSLSPATSSSRFTQPLYWAAPNTGIAYQVQVQVPQPDLTSLEDVRNIPVSGTNNRSAPLRNFATVQPGTVIGQYDRYNMDRMVTVTANIQAVDLGRAAAQVTRALQELGTPPPRVSVALRGQVQPLTELLTALRMGLLFAVVVIFLLLTANFQSIQLALVTVSAVPAVVAGSAMALWLWGTTVNLQSFMGAIMAVGVAVANAILLVTFAELSRMSGRSAQDAAWDGAVGRLRPILMTTLAMIAGMLPLAIGLGEGGEQTAPLGQAVIGGLAAGTLATILVVPSVFTLVRGRASRRSSSLDPDDPLFAVQAPKRSAHR